MKHWELILKHLKNETGPAEKETLQNWLNADTANQRLFDELQKTWELGNKLHAPLTINKSQAWQSIQRKIEQQQSKQPPARNYIWLKTAAVFLLAFFSLVWFYYSTSNTLQTVQTAQNDTAFVLPDGSQVSLNKNSSLSFPEKFSAGERNVTLTGEAFFEVAHMAQRPFKVQNEAFCVKVLGTSFNISAYPTSKKVTVSVLTGTVSLNNNADKQVLLVKGEAGVLTESGHELLKLTNEDNNVLAWKNKKLEFKQSNFKQVCETLEKYFDVNITVSNTALYNCRYTGYFEKPNLKEILTVLEKTLNLTAFVNKNQITFTGKGC